MHKGKRTDLVRIACRCETDAMRAEDVEDEMLSRAPKSQKTQQKTRVGNMDALDPTGQGIKESYERKLQLIDKWLRRQARPRDFLGDSGCSGRRPCARGDQRC